MKRTPYVDMAVWGPFGRKALKHNKFRTWIPDGAGGYESRELPGQENHTAWLVSWRVFVSAALMLGLAASASLEAYESKIERLLRLWADAWHLIYVADDLLRAEGIERIRRGIVTKQSAGHPTPQSWSSSEPWSACFFEAAEQTTFWTEHVIDPASSWRSRGSHGRLTSMEETLVQQLDPHSNFPSRKMPGAKGE